MGYFYLPFKYVTQEVFSVKTSKNKSFPQECAVFSLQPSLEKLIFGYHVVY